MEEVEPEIEEAGRNRHAVDEDVALDEVPAAGPDHERREAVVEAVGLALGAVERELAPDGGLQRRLAADDVRPRRRQRVLEVGHEDPGARVEGVDHHLRLGRPGDLDPPIVEVRAAPGRRSSRPPRTSAVAIGKSGRTPASSSFWRSRRASRSATRSRAEPALQVGDEARGRPASGSPRRPRRRGVISIDASLTDEC